MVPSYIGNPPFCTGIVNLDTLERREKQNESFKMSNKKDQDASTFRTDITAATFNNPRHVTSSYHSTIKIYVQKQEKFAIL